MTEQVQPPSAAGTRWVIPPDVPPPRYGLRPTIRWFKRLLRRLRPERSGSEAWLKRHGLLVVGEHSYGRPRVIVYAGDSSRVLIGRWCSIASDVEIMPGGNHRTDIVTTYPIQRRLHAQGRAPADMPLPEGDVISHGDVVIGNDVWIGRGVRILGGVTIGDGAVVAAYSVVTRSVEPYTIAAGVPARAVRSRFPEEIVAALLRIRWWDWDEEVVIARAGELTSEDVESFTRAYDPAGTSEQRRASR